MCRRALLELNFALGKSHGSGRDLAVSSLHVSTRLAHGATKDPSVVESPYDNRSEKHRSSDDHFLKDLDAAPNLRLPDRTSQIHQGSSDILIDSL